MIATVASTILAQLGGNRFLAMTGAKNLLNGGDYLQFDVPARMVRGRANKVRITLDASDTYTLRAYRFSASKLTCPQVGDAMSAIPCENLQAAFTRMTGLDTHL